MNDWMLCDGGMGAEKGENIRRVRTDMFKGVVRQQIHGSEQPRLSFLFGTNRCLAAREYGKAEAALAPRSAQ